MSVESPVSVERVFSALGNEDYWRARLAVFGAGVATLNSLSVDTDGTVAAVVAVSLLRDQLPKLITRSHRFELEMVQNERWSRIDGGRLRGEVGVAVLGAPLSGVGVGLLAPVWNGSRLNYTATVEVDVPLVGGAVERFINGHLAEGIGEFVRFTTEWIAENG